MSKNKHDKAYSYFLKMKKQARATGIKTVPTDIYLAGFEDCEKEYEEKLRWIPIEEKLPEPNSDVLAKGINGRIEVIHFKETQFSTVHHLRYVTHWRYFL